MVALLLQKPVGLSDVHSDDLDTSVFPLLLAPSPGKSLALRPDLLKLSKCSRRVAIDGCVFLLGLSWLDRNARRELDALPVSSCSDSSMPFPAWPTGAANGPVINAAAGTFGQTVLLPVEFPVRATKNLRHTVTEGELAFSLWEPY